MRKRPLSGAFFSRRILRATAAGESPGRSAWRPSLATLIVSDADHVAGDCERAFFNLAIVALIGIGEPGRHLDGERAFPGRRVECVARVYQSELSGVSGFKNRPSITALLDRLVLPIPVVSVPTLSRSALLPPRKR
jgi:hypothetical protein